MTQQDESGQGAATEHPAPQRPSPYLDAGESVPQAYLAPPQPGKPGYGAAPGYRAGQRPTGSGQGFGQRPVGQPGSGQPGARQSRYGQSRYGQSRYGQAGGRPAFGIGPAGRDPALAAAWERLAAGVLDWTIIVVASVLAFWAPLVRVWREFDAVMTNYQHSSSPAAQAALNSVVAQPANQHVLWHWALAMFGIALAYYWVQHAAWGATIGKRALGVKVVQASDRSRIGIKAAGIRAVAFLVGPAMLWLLAFPILVIGGGLWAADAGLSLVDPRAQCLHDKLAGTIVIRQRWLDKQAKSASSSW